MPRSAPPFTLPALTAPPNTSWELALETITPMFGGSATTREVDATHPVRAASVRGHLRFWWRATTGATLKTAQQLFEAEEKIWGSAEQFGAVRVEIVNQRADPPRIPQLGRELTYAIFPFQEQRGNWENPGKAAAAATSASFTLRLTCSTEFQPQVESAVQAWVMFGGIGSRTRRGCGSLAAEHLTAVPTAPETSPRLLTTLPSMYFKGKVQSDPVRAWAEAVDLYKRFRQQRNQGSGPRPGRSHWPESDSIRRFTPQSNFQHAPVHPVKSGFPRADLGLPIIFHFQKQREYVRPEPQDHTLQGSAKGQERFASPVITKAVALAGGFAPVIMILDAPHVWEGSGVGFRQGETLSRQQLELTPTERQQVQPLGGLPIREALAEFIKSNNFQEVSL